jgi:hypothetical protein
VGVPAPIADPNFIDPAWQVRFFWVWCTEWMAGVHDIPWYTIYRILQI